MDNIKNGWFTENNTLWPEHKLSLKIENILHQEKSNYQDILVIKTKFHGIVLILDGIIQCTEHDEFSYQEMISFLPLCAHPNPSKVLIVGGGDGGVAREVAKHPLVKEIVQVEIDERVIEVSKKFLPFMAIGFQSPKLTLKICDGFEYLRQNPGQFDVIITDSSDPIGPASNLFTESYFGLLKKTLKNNGIICSQAGSIWENCTEIRNLMNGCKQHFNVVKYGISSVPTYPTGHIGFILASDDEKKVFEEPCFKFNSQELEDKKLKYYSYEMHKSAFVLPNVFSKILYE
nr:spermidine synthase [Onthophagus taurus]